MFDMRKEPFANKNTLCQSLLTGRYLIGFALALQLHF
jgi:hypothetical protein